ncbi:MAG: ATP-binding protein, partial [Bacteroidota bacterium]
MNRTIKDNGKVWLGFAVMLVTVVLLLTWSYQSYEQLNASISSLTEPDRKAALLQKTLQGITKSEKQITSYVLTEDDSTYESYLSEIAAVELSIDSLKYAMAEDSLQIQRVDTLQHLFWRKLSYLDDYLAEKRISRTNNYSSQALRKIEASTSDSARTVSQVLTKLKRIDQTRPIVEQSLVTTEYKAPGFWPGVKRLFGGKQLKVDTLLTLKNDTLQTTEVVMDTLITIEYHPDTVLAKIRSILLEVAKQEFQKQTTLSSKELVFLRQDMLLTAEIDQVIQALETHDQAYASDRRAESREVIRRSSAIILICGVVGVLLGGFFLFNIGRDLTHSYALRKQLETERNKATELAKMKEDFLANMSHEVRTPLNSILGFSRLMKSTELSRQQMSYTRALQESTDYLSELVDGILDYSKFDAQSVVLNESPVHVPTLAEELLSLFDNQCRDRGLFLDVRYGEELVGIDVLADRFRLKQVLTNLLNNALKFTQEGGVSVAFQCQRRLDKVHLMVKVRDTGKGIAPDKFKTIFNVFEQEDGSIAREYGGTGLGLAIVKMIVTAMQGQITVDSQLGQYTEFRLKFVLAYQTHREPLPTVHVPSQTSLVGRVVLVEDDAWNRTLLRTLLQQRGVTVASFAEVDTALAYIVEHREGIDLVLTDISMPTKGGVDLLQSIQAMGLSRPVVGITAHVLPQRLEGLRAAGFAEVLTKPFREEDIHQMLGRHLSNTSINRAAQEQRLFDLEGIRQYSGDDPMLFDQLVSELIDHHEESVEHFAALLDQGDADPLAALSHRMIQTYHTLAMDPIVESLKSVELYHEVGNGDRMWQEARALLPRLQAVAEDLQEV